MMIRPALIHVDDVPFASGSLPGPAGEPSGVRVPVGRGQGASNACFLARFAPGLTRPKHRHERCDELVFVRRGRGRFGPDGREVRGGSARLIPRGAVHWLRNIDPEEPAEVVAFLDGAASMEETGRRSLGPASEEEFRSMSAEEGARVYPTFHVEEVDPAGGPAGVGVGLRFLLGGWCGARSLLFHLALPPGAGVPPRRCDGGELILHVLRGRGVAEAGGEEDELRPGHFHYIPRGTSYGLRNAGDAGPLECVGVLFGVASPAEAGGFFPR